VSHDLRGPLATLSAAVSVLNRRRDQVPETAQAAIDALDDQVQSFNQLVLDLLEISRFEAGTAVLDRRDVDLQEFVRVVLGDTEAHHDLPINTIPASSIRAEIDPRRIQQVLLNLLDNAERYAGGATRIEIARSDTGRVSITVEDRGPGVPVELREAIFERYERGSAAHDPEMPDGTGLGLALAAQHVALHHGSIRVEPNPGGGSRFVIDLPEAP
jgi:two-component system, OmpR family, sensor histidine kinase MtrB